MNIRKHLIKRLIVWLMDEITLLLAIRFVTNLYWAWFFFSKAFLRIRSCNSKRSIDW